MTRRLSHALPVCALALLAGCFGTETGNPPFAPELAGESGGPMGIAPPIGIDDGWLSVENVALSPSCAASDDGVIVRHDPAALALSGAQSLETEPVLQEGEYCQLRFDRAVFAAADPSALSAHSLAIDATAQDGSAVHVRSDATGSYRFVGTAPFSMTPDAGGLIVFVDESLLFNGVSLAGTERESDGSIEISATKNAAVLATIEAQLPGALALYRDGDGNGQLSLAERRAGPVATLAP